jgi:hypothetical protein
VKARSTVLGAIIGIVTTVGSMSAVTTTVAILGPATAVTMLTASEAEAWSCRKSGGRTLCKYKAIREQHPASKVKIHRL